MEPRIKSCKGAFEESPSRNKRLRAVAAFDLGDLDTYYTRPMPPSGSKPLDVDRLADGEADIDFSVSLAELPRLRSRLASAEGTVDGHVHFSREAGIAVAEVRMSGTASLQCQRCMERMTTPVETSVRVALLPLAADVARVPEDLEPMLAPGGRISIDELVEEELMLFLPIVPLHENSPACGASVPPPLAQDEVEEPTTTQKPFAQLQELLARKDKTGQ